MSADPEEIQHESVYREKLLRVPGGFEPAHLSIALPRRLMRDLRCLTRLSPSLEALFLQLADLVPQRM